MFLRICRSKAMADVHLTRMHYSRKSFKKANAWTSFYIEFYCTVFFIVFFSTVFHFMLVVLLYPSIVFYCYSFLLYLCIVFYYIPFYCIVFHCIPLYCIVFESIVFHFSCCSTSKTSIYSSNLLINLIHIFIHNS